LYYYYYIIIIIHEAIEKSLPLWHYGIIFFFFYNIGSKQ